jgi:predicted O-methyltransferase YrrM
MGSVDIKFVNAVRQRLALGRAVESGTFKGVTARKLARKFPQVVTIELSPELHAKAADRLASLRNVTCLQGHSVDVLPQLDEIPQGTLYFLDGHFSAGPTAGQAEQCPVLREIEAIGTGHPSDVIVIDDARLFATAPPPPNEQTHWPSLVEVMDKLREVRPDHIVTVVNDQVIAVPQDAKLVLDNYGQRVHKMSWPTAKAHAAVETVMVSRPATKAYAVVDDVRDRVGV